MEQRDEGSHLLVSYLTLRKVIGFLGIFLPVALVAGDWTLGGRWGSLRPSISAYYDSVMGDAFVGILFAAGTFLLTYRGHDRRDNRAGNLACLFAVVVALFPGTPEQLDWVRNLHLIAGAGLFSVFAYFSLCLFTLSSPVVPTTDEKRKRNRVYRICGWTIVACIVGVALYELFGRGSAIDAMLPVFVLESIALLAFGLSWFIKGETLLQDR